MVNTDRPWPTTENQSPHSIQERSPTLRAATLWPFALALYHAPLAKSHCLTLQDEGGVDVCLLLWRLWLYAHRVVPEQPSKDLVKAHEKWQQRYTVPLRTLRQRVRRWTDIGAQSWYGALLHTELIAERTALLQLAQGSIKDAIVRSVPQRQAMHSVVQAYPALSSECHIALMQLIIITDDICLSSL